MAHMLSQEQRLKNLECPRERIDMVLDTDTYNEVDDQFRFFREGIKPAPLPVMFIHQHPTQKGIPIKTVAFIELQLFEPFFQLYRIPRADLTDPDVDAPHAVRGFHDQHPMAAHRDRGFSPQIAGSDIRDFIAELPMPGGFESLNAGVAAGIALYEILRQRG